MTDRRVLPTSRRAGIGAAGLVAVLLVAASLRPAITSVGPVLDLIGADTGLSQTALGLLGALPLLAFAVVSPLVPGPQRRLGLERMLLFALVVLAVGTVARSLPTLPALWLGTALIGAAIAVGNVLLPSLIKRDFGGH
ncbi:MAG TPA: MFS transporter, partial [Actinomycetes bacterium]|nr:MFS transporter [Actinomycetes bacterium]